MLKKGIIAVIVIVLLLSLTGCGNKEKENIEINDNNSENDFAYNQEDNNDIKDYKFIYLCEGKKGEKSGKKYNSYWYVIEYPLTIMGNPKFYNSKTKETIEKYSDFAENGYCIDEEFEGYACNGEHIKKGQKSEIYGDSLIYTFCLKVSEDIDFSPEKIEIDPDKTVYFNTEKQVLMPSGKKKVSTDTSKLTTFKYIHHSCLLNFDGHYYIFNPIREFNNQRVKDVSGNTILNTYNFISLNGNEEQLSKYMQNNWKIICNDENDDNYLKEIETPQGFHKVSMVKKYVDEPEARSYWGFGYEKNDNTINITSELDDILDKAWYGFEKDGDQIVICYNCKNISDF